MIIAKPELLGGTEHAMRGNASDGCRLNLQTVRDAGTRECERHNAAGRSIRRTADNLPQRAAAVVDLTDLEFVGAGVRCSLHNACHNNEFEALVKPLDALYFDACSRQRPRHISGRETSQIHPLS